MIRKTLTPDFTSSTSETNASQPENSLKSTVTMSSFTAKTERNYPECLTIIT